MIPDHTVTGPLKILIVEDHDEFRRRLDSMLSSYPDLVCRTATDGESALRHMEQDHTDVVIMDINLQGSGAGVGAAMDGIECTHRIRNKYPRTQVLICTVHEDEEKIFSALKAGANGYVLKRAPLPELVEAVRQVHRGESPMTGSIARKVVGSFQLKPLQNGERLTNREEEVLDLLAAGLKAKDIADELFVSITTIRSHIRGIYEKLQVQNRVEMLKKLGRVR